MMKHKLFYALFGLLILSSSNSIASDRLAVAVLEFENTSAASEDLKWSKGLANFFQTDLSQISRISVVERSRINDLLKEMNLAAGTFIDESTAARLGKGIGAKAIFTGSYLIDDNKVRIDAKLIEVETGKIMFADNATGSRQDIFAIQKLLSEKAIDHLGIALSSEERVVLRREYTRDTRAFDSYSRALLAKDGGDTNAAQRYLQAAIRYDSSFQLASSELAIIMKEALTTVQGYYQAVSTKEQELAALSAKIASKLSAHFEKQIQIISNKRYDDEYFAAILLAAFHSGLLGKSDDELAYLFRYNDDYLSQVPTRQALSLHKKVLDRLISETDFFRHTAFALDPSRAGETQSKTIGGRYVDIPVPFFLSDAIGLSKPHYIAIGADCKRWMGTNPPGKARLLRQEQEKPAWMRGVPMTDLPPNAHKMSPEELVAAIQKARQDMLAAGQPEKPRIHPREIALCGDLSVWWHQSRAPETETRSGWPRERLPDELEVDSRDGYHKPSSPHFIIETLELPESEETLALYLAIYEYSDQHSRDYNFKVRIARLATKGVEQKWSKDLLARSILLIKSLMDHARSMPGWDNMAKDYAERLLQIGQYIESQ